MRYNSFFPPITYFFQKRGRSVIFKTSIIIIIINNSTNLQTRTKSESFDFFNRSLIGAKHAKLMSNQMLLIIL